MDSTVSQITNSATINVADGVMLTCPIYTGKNGSNLNVQGTLNTLQITRETGSAVSVSNILVSGSNDSNLDLSGWTGHTHVEFAKTKSGTTDTITHDGDACMRGVQNGVINLRGTADYTTCGDLTTQRIDTSQLDGAFTPGSGTITERANYKELAYTASSFVAFLNEGKYIVSQGGFIQDARNI